MQRPDYKGSRDEIVRMDIEAAFTRSIQLKKCCEEKPKELFRSNHDYFIKCQKCGRQTRKYRHLYEAKQAWNEEIIGGIT